MSRPVPMESRLLLEAGPTWNSKNSVSLFCPLPSPASNVSLYLKYHYLKLKIYDFKLFVNIGFVPERYLLFAFCSLTDKFYMRTASFRPDRSYYCPDPP
jgi:hypothetical protein